MSISLTFKTNRGIIYSRKFLPGEGISIYGKASTLLVPINPGSQVRLIVENNSGEVIFYKDKSTDFLGDFDFYFVAPVDNVQLNVKLFVVYSVSGEDSLTIPIAIGTASPKSLPNLPVEHSIFEYLVLAGVLVGGVLIYRIVKDG